MSKFIPIAALGALWSTTALAGGVGVMGTGGFHEARAYYYRDDGIQGIDTQSRPNVGFGGEALLGDKDDKIIGIMRLYYLSDFPVNDPDLSGEDTKNFEFTYPAAADQGAYNVGVMTVGVQWGVWGDPGGFQATVNTLAGSGFATTDSLEFFLGEVGGGVTYALSDQIQTYANVAFSVRYRKRVFLGENMYAGIRYMFD